MIINIVFENLIIYFLRPSSIQNKTKTRLTKEIGSYTNQARTYICMYVLHILYICYLYSGHYYDYQCTSVCYQKEYLIVIGTHV